MYVRSYIHIEKDYCENIWIWDQICFGLWKNAVYWSCLGSLRYDARLHRGFLLGELDTSNLIMLCVAFLCCSFGLPSFYSVLLSFV
jgi:hypothetical protein